MYYFLIILSIAYSITLSPTITFSINMNNADYFNQDYDNVEINPFRLEDQRDGLVNPPNNAFIRTIHVPFEWIQIPNAESYSFQITNTFGNSMFDEGILLDTLVQDIAYIDTETIEWDNNYWWRIKPNFYDQTSGEWSEVSSFQIGSKKFPERQAEIYNDDLIQDGLVAFGGFGGTSETDLASCVIDKYGNEIWNDGYLSFIINHINEYGNVYGLSNYNWPLYSGSQISWTHEYDLDFVWSAPTTDVGIDIHEIKQLSNGNYMAFVPDFSRFGPIHGGSWSFLFQAQGYQADGVTNEFPYIGMRIVEWDQDGNEVWNWDPFDHFTMEHTDLYGGTWWAAFNDGAFDWMHSNAFHFDEEESVIYVSHRHLSRISKIAYPSGEVIWNMGMPDGYSTGSDNICTDLGFSFQHNVQLLDDGSLIFFDNGNLSQMLLGDDTPTTRIRNIRVIDDSYCETQWEYELPANLFGAGMGSVQLLENGNYLIYTFGNGLNVTEPTLREITANQEVLWNYQGIQNAFWYRTYKIPSLHPEIFSVRANNYTEIDNENVIEASSSVEFIITNQSGYNNNYNYIFSDLIDGGSPMFNYEQGEITIGPYESINLSFIPNEASLSSSNVQLSIWPSYHEYALKELLFNVVLSNQLVGDINNDEEINVIDVVILVNMILEGINQSSGADLNGDGSINVLDIVMLVNLILQ